MNPNRWYHLRHPEGFDTEHLAAFESGCRVWRGHCEAVLANWSLIHGGGERPRYDWYEPELSADRRIASLPIGGETAKELEDISYPEQLYAYLPLRFSLDLELGRRSAGGKDVWRPLHEPQAKEALRAILGGRPR